jgi:hypothetical protein
LDTGSASSDVTGHIVSAVATVPDEQLQEWFFYAYQGGATGDDVPTPRAAEQSLGLQQNSEFGVPSLVLNAAWDAAATGDWLGRGRAGHASAVYGEDATVLAAAEIGGWTTTGNVPEGADGTQGGMMYLDSRGLYAADRVVHTSDFNEKCDYASAIRPCEFSCAYSDAYPHSGFGAGVMDFRGDVALASAQPIVDFPSDMITVSMWVRVPAGAPLPEARRQVLVSYTLHEPEDEAETAAVEAHASHVELLIYNPSDITLAINTKVTQTGRGHRTGVSVVDGRWHLITLTWRSSNGELQLMDNGKTVYVGGPYRSLHRLRPGGVLSVGQFQLRDGKGVCAHVEVSGEGVERCTWSGAAKDGWGLVGYVQDVRVWDYVLTDLEAAQGLQWPYELGHEGLIVYWRVEPGTTTSVADTEMEELFASNWTMVVDDSSHFGADHVGVINMGYSVGASPVAADTPSSHPHFPCGAVHHNVWYFAMPDAYLGNKVSAYNGRLQFRLRVTSHSGTVRDPRGAVIMEGAGSRHTPGIRLSFALGNFQQLHEPLGKQSRDLLDAPAWHAIQAGHAQSNATRARTSVYGSTTAWVQYSVPLREDFGWLREPLGAAATADDMLSVLGELTGMYVRGDAYQMGSNGDGTEVMYIQDVRLIAGAALAGGT